MFSEPRATEITERVMERFVEFNYIEQQPIAIQRKTPSNGNRNRQADRMGAYRSSLIRAKPLLREYTAHCVSQMLGFSQNYLSNIKSRRKDLWFEIIGE